MIDFDLISKTMANQHQTKTELVAKLINKPHSCPVQTSQGKAYKSDFYQRLHKAALLF